jgi:hypothetical protein
MKKGQAMLETVIAVLCVSVLFLFLFHLSQVALSRILLDYACSRAARSRSVGFNDFMCEKAAKVAVIPIAGERTWPIEDIDEVGRIPDYLASQDGSYARGILDYDYWNSFFINVSRGFGDTINASAQIIRQEGMVIKSSSKIESHYPLYLYDSGL